MRQDYLKLPPMCNIELIPNFQVGIYMKTKQKEQKMQITLNIPNEQLFEKILWLLNRFKHDGVEIITNIQKAKAIDKNPRLKQFEEIINTRSKNSIKVDKSTILNPHSELSNDIS